MYVIVGICELGECFVWWVCVSGFYDGIRVGIIDDEVKFDVVIVIGNGGNDYVIV